MTAQAEARPKRSGLKKPAAAAKSVARISASCGPRPS